MHMSGAHALSLLTAFFLLEAAACTGFRHILLRPKPEGWQTVGPALRVALFLLCAILTYAGVRLVSAVVEGVDSIPPNATPMFAALAGAIALYKTAALWNEYAQRRPWIIEKLKEDGFRTPDMISPAARPPK